MPPLIRARITYDPAPKRLSRVFSNITKEANRAGALFWFGHLLPKHFQPAAESAYGYRPRKEKTLKRKKRAKQPLHALVGTGQTEALARASRGGIRAYPTRVSFTLYTPRYILQRPRRTTHPDMAREIFTVRQDELRQIEQVTQRHAVKQLRRSGRPHTVQIG